MVVLKLVASYRWVCGLGKLSTILEMKICIGNCTCSCLECSSLQFYWSGLKRVMGVHLTLLARVPLTLG
jgi:hypothetical protein